MPYEWTIRTASERRLVLRPYRSLTARGFVTFIGITAALISIPLFGLLGTPLLWGLLPFELLAIAGIWMAISRNAADADITEELALNRDRISLQRIGPRNRRQAWEANPHWVHLGLYRQGGPVANYLTLSGAGREVELGAFLTAEERVALHDELDDCLRALRQSPAFGLDPAGPPP